MSFFRHLFRLGRFFRRGERGAEERGAEERTAGSTIVFHINPPRRTSGSIPSMCVDLSSGTDEAGEELESSFASLQERSQTFISEPQFSEFSSREDSLLAIGSTFCNEDAGSPILRHLSDDSATESEYHAYLSPRARSPRPSKDHKLVTRLTHGSSGRASDSSDALGLSYSSESEFIHDFENLFNLLERPALFIPESRHAMTSHETILLSTATTLAHHWLADYKQPFPARFPFPFVYDQFDQGFHQASKYPNRPIPGIVVCGTGENNTSRPLGSNEDDGQRRNYTINRYNKRPSNPSRDDEDDGEGTGGTDGGQPAPSKNKKQRIGRLFACPFYKRIPLRYSAHNMREMEYRGCATGCFRDISRLK